MKTNQKEVVSIRLKKETKQLLSECANALNLTTSKYISLILDSVCLATLEREKKTND